MGYFILIFSILSVVWMGVGICVAKSVSRLMDEAESKRGSELAYWKECFICFIAGGPIFLIVGAFLHLSEKSNFKDRVVNWLSK